MPLTKRKLRKIRQKVYRENKPDMLTDIYYVYDNPALMQDTYTAKCLTNKVLSNELHPNKLSGKKYPYTLSYTDIYKEIKRETDEQQTHCTVKCIIARLLKVLSEELYKASRQLIKH